MCSKNVKNRKIEILILVPNCDQNIYTQNFVACGKSSSCHQNSIYKAVLKIRRDIFENVKCAWQKLSIAYNHDILTWKIHA